MKNCNFFFSIFFSLLLIISSCENNKENEEEVISKNNKDKSIQLDVSDTNIKNNVKTELVNFEPALYLDTLLSGGYHLSRRINYDECSQSLTLVNGDEDVKLISEMDIGLPNKNIGYIHYDFGKCFSFVNSFGWGNPIIVSLINKENGENLIPDFCGLIDIDTSDNILLYSEEDVPSELDSMTLLDIDSMKYEKYPFPNQIFSDPEILYRIDLLGVTDSNFTIKYILDDYSHPYEQIYNRK